MICVNSFVVDVVASMLHWRVGSSIQPKCSSNFHAWMILKEQKIKILFTLPFQPLLVEHFHQLASPSLTIQSARHCQITGLVVLFWAYRLALGRKRLEVKKEVSWYDIGMIISSSHNMHKIWWSLDFYCFHNCCLLNFQCVWLIIVKSTMYN